MAILSVRWDVRSLWGMTMFSVRAYLVLLFVLAIWIIYGLWPMLRSRPTIGISQAIPPNLRSTAVRRLFRADQLLIFLRLIFGVVLSDAVFGAFRGVSESRMSLSEIPLQRALEPVTALSFVVCAVFVLLHVFLWGVKHRIQRAYPSL